MEDRDCRILGSDRWGCHLVRIAGVARDYAVSEAGKEEYGPGEDKARVAEADDGEMNQVATLSGWVEITVPEILGIRTLRR